jgi:hypothetical protein
VLQSCGNDGIDIHGQFFIFDHNRVLDNITTNWAQTHPDGIQCIASLVDGYSSVQHAIIRNNVFRNQTQNVFLEGMADGSQPCSDISVYNNVCYMTSGIVNGQNMDLIATKHMEVLNSQSVYIYNNTLGRSGTSTIVVDARQAGQSGTNCIHIKNNIFNNPLSAGLDVTSLATNSIGPGELDFNDYYNTGVAVGWGGPVYLTVGAFHTAFPAMEVHGKDGNPSLEAFPAPCLIPGSPCIGSATNLSGAFTTDRDGFQRSSILAWDMGAYAARAAPLPPKNLRPSQ